METELDVIDHRAADAPARIDAACRELGFFRIPLDVVDRDLAEAAFTDAQRFFALPEATKQLVAFPEPGYPYGYAPVAFEALAASTGQPTPPDLKETLSVGPDCLDDAVRTATMSETERWLRSPSRWPDQPASLRASWSAYFRALATVSAELLSTMAVALALPADHFEALIDRHTSALRALRYPPIEHGVPDGALRAGAHTDYGTLTILRTDGVPGLEVQQPDGRWVAIRPEPDTFVVNLGDSIARWTNDRWRSTLHRVTPTTPRTRHSMAFFHMANCDAVIECLPTCTDEVDSPRYEPVTAGPWLRTKFSQTVA